ncbi:conserved Plasmodium protein, unknown function [Plasmodium vinckei]|uniref:Uncharacterized protein n=1 Tax=Plasmodium vinckei TaxID=5860 RepID=A0A6V7T7X3_PLAVN|nr:conserved Plasmodium protein, unknown function [Plasmodium vinckei]
MPDNLELLHFYNIYNDRRNKWKIGINKLNFNIENYKNIKTKIFLYVLWSILLFIYIFELLLNLLFVIYIQNINIIIKTIFIFSIFEIITVILLTTQAFFIPFHFLLSHLGQKINYVFSCIRTSTILKNKIRKDLEKKSFLFEDQSYGTFTMDFNA